MVVSVAAKGNLTRMFLTSGNYSNYYDAGVTRVQPKLEYSPEVVYIKQSLLLMLKPCSANEYFQNDLWTSCM